MSSPPRPRVTYLVGEYPQLSQTYIKNEIDTIATQFDVQVISAKPAGEPYSDHLPYSITKDIDEVSDLVRDFKPHVIHTHWFTQVSRARQVAHAVGVPFTVRSHSFDTLPGCIRPPLSSGPRVLRRWVRSRQRLRRELIPLLQDEACIGVLCFPFVAEPLRRAGVPESKLRSSFPVVDVQRFLDRGENGEGVMSVGAALPKKQYGDFLSLASRDRKRPFDLYAFDYNVAALREENEAAGCPVNLCDPVPPGQMPMQFKRHEWLVYTGARGQREVGWPCAVAEAQASGVGVVMPDLGRDLREYVGPAGFLYRSLDEAHDIISQPFPDEKRELGYDLAARSDIRKHISVLTDLWPVSL